MSTQFRPKVVVIGAGFAGVWAAKRLAKGPVDVTLVDRFNYHTFFPLLYQVGAAELEPENIAYPVRSIIRKKKNVRFAMATVTGIDFEAQTVATTENPIPYDYLMLAPGSSPNYFGIPGATEHAFPLRTLEQGVALRNHILACFEKAAQETDDLVRQRLLTFIIVGGGPTGIEFAGALAELVHGPIIKDFARYGLPLARVLIVERSDAFMPMLPKRLQKYVPKRLEKIGVEVMLNSGVKQITGEGVVLHDDSEIRSETVVWTAGVQGEISARNWGVPTGKGGRVNVLPTLQVPDHPNIYAAGDFAYLEVDGKSMPMVAPTATQQGSHAAENVLRRIEGSPEVDFKYFDMGTMAVIGRNAAIANLFNKWRFTSFPAWVVWLTVHLFKLIGFRNRILVLTSWAWDYFFYERVVRLILGVRREKE